GLADPPGKAEEKPPGKEAGSAQVRALLEERLKALKTIASETEQAFTSSGRIPFEELVKAKVQVLLGELDLCNTDKERIEILEKIVGHAKELEQVVDANFTAGRTPHVDLLKAQVDRLNAEIALERARARAAAPPK